MSVNNLMFNFVTFITVTITWPSLHHSELEINLVGKSRLRRHGFDFSVGDSINVDGSHRRVRNVGRAAATSTSPTQPTTFLFPDRRPRATQRRGAAGQRLVLVGVERGVEFRLGGR